MSEKFNPSDPKYKKVEDLAPAENLANSVNGEELRLEHVVFNDEIRREMITSLEGKDFKFGMERFVLRRSGDERYADGNIIHHRAGSDEYDYEGDLWRTGGRERDHGFTKLDSPDSICNKVLLAAIKVAGGVENIEIIDQTFIENELDSAYVKAIGQEARALIYSKNGNEMTDARIMMDEWEEEQRGEGEDKVVGTNTGGYANGTGKIGPYGGGRTGY